MEILNKIHIMLKIIFQYQICQIHIKKLVFKMKIIFISSKSITFNNFLKTQADYLAKKGFKIEAFVRIIIN